jgi:hypothetical protein
MAGGKRLEIDGEADALRAFGRVAGERGAFGRLEVARAEVPDRSAARLRFASPRETPGNTWP